MTKPILKQTFEEFRKQLREKNNEMRWKKESIRNRYYSTYSYEDYNSCEGCNKQQRYGYNYYG